MEAVIVYLLVTSACQNNSLSICHPLFDENLLTVFFLDLLCAFAFFTSAKSSEVEWSGQPLRAPVLLPQLLAVTLTFRAHRS
jgi:hypothetical protein